MKLVCGSNHFASHSVDIALKKISEIGFKYVDLWACPSLCDHVDPKKMSAQEVQKLLDDNHLKAVSLTIYLTTDEQKEERIKLAADLKIPLVIWEPSPSVDWPDHMKMNEKAITYGSPAETFNQYVDRLKHSLELCKKYGVKLGLEVPHVYTQGEHLHQILKLSNTLVDPYLEYVVAPTHAQARGFTTEQVIETVGAAKTNMLYLWDVKKGFNYPDSDRAFGTGEQQLPGGGETDFKQMIANVEALGFDGWYNIKCHGTEGWTDVNYVVEQVKRSHDFIVALLQEQAREVSR